MLMEQEDVLGRYRHLRAISRRHQGDALSFLAPSAIMDHARRLGLVVGQTIVADSSEELTLVYDLAIYTAKDGRSRAIDRYAKAVQTPAYSDQRRMLDAMCGARFSIWRVERRHDAFGIVVTDLLRKAEGWLVDEGLAASAENGLCFASRFYEADRFMMTAGSFVPLLPSLIEEVLDDPMACRYRELERIADDPRFAAAVYRLAIAEGFMERVVFN